MNIAKNMEAIFVAALVFAGSTSYLVESLPEAHAHIQAPLASSVATPTRMAVVTVTAKRMTAAEKKASLQAERAAGSRA
jgi:predicted branched-subunit amino acid permease